MPYTKNQMLEATSELVDAAKAGDNVIFFIPKMEEISEKENMENEYELLGYYVTKHPLENFKNKMRQLDNTASIKEYSSGDNVHVGGIISSSKNINTKAGKKMAFLQLEDNNGRVEVVVFSNLFNKVESLLEKNNLIEIRGKVEIDEKEINEEVIRTPKIIASSIVSLENIKQLSSINLRLTSKDDFKKIKELLTERRGDVPVLIEYEGFSVETNYKIPQNGDLINELRNLCLIKEVEK